MRFNIDTDVNETPFEDLKPYYEITDAQTVIDLMGDTIILNRYKEKSQFEYLIDHTVDIAALCWNNRDENGNKLQKTLIKFKVDIDDKVTRMLPLNKFMISLIFLRCVIKYIDIINIDDFILLDPYLTENGRVEIQNRISKFLTSMGLSRAEQCEIFADYSLGLKNLNRIFSYADMVVFDADNLFLDHYRESKIIRDINNTEYDTTIQPAEMIESNAEKYKVLSEEMNRRNNPIFKMNRFVKIIKPKQIEEMYINFCNVPDGENILPVTMNGNGFKQGYHEPAEFYAATIAARVPALMNNKYMGQVGYFGRNMWILTCGTISPTVWDCGSRNFITAEIDEAELDMKHGRYYLNEETGTFRILNRNDKHLLGKKLKFRSPCTCNLLEDCCYMCYGTVSLNVGELPGGFIYTTETMTGIIGQNVLSAKHLLKTQSERVEFSNIFDDWFTFDNSTIMPKDEKRFDIYLKEDYQDYISETLTLYIGKDLKPITIGHYANAYIPDEIVSEMKTVTFDDDVYYKISSYKIFEKGVPFCEINPINIMMTAKYFNLNKLFESNISKFTNLDDAVSTLTHLLHKTIPILSVHGEIIIGHLTRRVDNKLLRPNWLNENEQYQLLNLKDALRNTESITQALAFENTRHHLFYSIFDERNKINRVGARSFTDYLFGLETL